MHEILDFSGEKSAAAREKRRGGGRERSVRVAGLSQAGKTAFVRYLALRRPPRPLAPTNVLEVTRVPWKTAAFEFWDSKKFGTAADQERAVYYEAPAAADSGSLQQRLLSAPAAAAAAARQPPKFEAAVFVVDGSDSGRLRLAAREFQRFVDVYGAGTRVIAVVATHRDLPCRSPAELEHILNVAALCSQRDWRVFPVSCETGAGVFEVADWLLERCERLSSVRGMCRWASCCGCCDTI